MSSSLMGRHRRSPGLFARLVAGTADLFVRTWQWLDNSALRAVWPFALGATIAGLAVLFTTKVVFAVAVTAGVYLFLFVFSRFALRRHEELQKLLD